MCRLAGFSTTAALFCLLTLPTCGGRQTTTNLPPSEQAGGSQSGAGGDEADGSAGAAEISDGGASTTDGERTPAPTTDAGGVMAKLGRRFTRQTGCLYNTIAFCIAKDDPLSMKDARAILGESACRDGYPVHSVSLDCDYRTGQTCRAELAPSDCLPASDHGPGRYPMTDTGWRKVLALIAIPGVSKVNYYDPPMCL